MKKKLALAAMLALLAPAYYASAADAQQQSGSSAQQAAAGKTAVQVDQDKKDCAAKSKGDNTSADEAVKGAYKACLNALGYSDSDVEAINATSATAPAASNATAADSATKQ